MRIAGGSLLAFAALALGFASGACGGPKVNPPPPHPATASSSAAGGGNGGDGGGLTGATGTGGMGGAGGGIEPPPGCGDGMVVIPEKCDGDNLNGAVNCSDIGAGKNGKLSCTKLCTYDTSQCTSPEDCFNQLDDDKNGKADCDDAVCAAACTSACTPESTLTVSPLFSVVSGNTTGHANKLNAGCTAGNGAMSGPEIVYSSTMAYDGVLEVELQTGASLGVSVRKTCLQQGSELDCSPEPAGAASAQELKLSVKMGDVLFIVVQGYSPSDAGAYSLTVNNRKVACGDGYTDPPEGCDDSNVASGDGCSAACSLESTEVEPNNAPLQANTFVAPWFAAVQPAGDVDVVKVDVSTSPTTLTASVSAFDGGCQIGLVDSYLEILDKNGSTILAQDDDGGGGTCSSAMAANLGVGTYFVRVKASPNAAFPTFPYKLYITTSQDICGDHVITGAEQCDDGNTTAGDGCGPTCQWEISEKEPNNTTAQANAYVSMPKWHGKIAPVGDIDVVSVTLSASGKITAQVTDEGNGDCAGLKIVSHVDVLDTDGTTVLVSGNGSAGNYCAGASTSGLLPAGKYFVRVKAGALAIPGMSDTFSYGLDIQIQ